MGIRERMKPRIQDWAMGFMEEWRPETVSHAQGEVLEVGFGTGLNLRHYGPGVKAVTGLDPLQTEGVAVVEERIADASFPVQRTGLRADGELPFDAGRFDCVITTWTLCSIPDPLAALREMHRVLKPGGQYVFVEHGRSEKASTARWQERLNPIWRRIADGCNIDRKMDELVETGGFELTSMQRFRGRGPSVLASMYRGVAIRE
ncbi:MAG: class I SAM-dependent methyltransferase [Deltaproteobacteria bacterium]|jgi:ubiquinone/menaquinone biosynthesis C-methylase UbiE|nr:class I SAM-dependent methyltransferase [Deltaproteobacteria bacterium]